ncbi:hypothetical protein Patl1_36318 [Pistacia atlantica]|nr:hypothetical protein Patl1_36318 [Pistacia atlantica]
MALLIYSYDDLKPPTSPSPTTPGGKKDFSIVDGQSHHLPLQVQHQAVLKEYLQVPQHQKLHSPPLSGGNDVAKTTVASVIEENLSQNSTYHLSPYHMYEDMKPPTSPTPSPRKS